MMSGEERINVIRWPEKKANETMVPICLLSAMPVLQAVLHLQARLMYIAQLHALDQTDLTHVSRTMGRTRQALRSQLVRF